MGGLFNSEEIQSLLEDSRMGMWKLEIEKGKKNRLYGDSVMCDLIGVDENMDPEDVFSFFAGHIYPDDHELFLEYENKLERNHRAEITYRYNHPTLGLKTVRCGGKRSFFSDGTSSVTLGFHQDITNTVRLEQELKELYQQIMFALGNDYEAIHYADFELNTFSTIRSSQMMRDKGIETISKDYNRITKDIITATVPPSKRQDFIDLVQIDNLKDRISKENNFSYRFDVIKDDGSISVYEMRFAKVGGTKGVQGVVMGAKCIDDIVSEEIKLEKALEEANRAIAAKSEFLSRMSHDIRTPLNGIIGILNLDEAHNDNLELINANRKKAQVAANHLLSLLNDVLDMSKLEYDKTELVRESFNIVDLCTDILTICSIRANENGVTLIHDSGANLKYPFVYGSPLHVRQVLLNILNNGVKYNNPGGKLMASSRVSRVENNICFYEFTISDTGIGMSEEFMAHLFEPFTQERNDARSRYQGTGLGMAIVKTLLDKMGGSITVSSKYGQGSTFVITIPFEISDEEKHTGEKQLNESKSVEGMNVLVVEDNELNMDITRYILEDSKINVYEAVNGEIALNMFLENPEGSYDAILMDIMMPQMNGYEATKSIRKSDKRDAGTIPIIAMTANAFAEDVKKARECGMNDHIAKPINAKELIYTLGVFRR